MKAHPTSVKIPADLAAELDAALEALRAQEPYRTIGAPSRHQVLLLALRRGAAELARETLDSDKTRPETL